MGNIFDQLMALPAIHKDITPSRTMANFTNTAPSDVFSGMRGTFSSVSLERLTPEILQTIKSEFNVSHPCNWKRYIVGL